MTPNSISNMDLTSAIIGHLVADYLLQFDWIAENKKKNSWVCALHCLIWSICVSAMGHIWNITAFTIFFVTHYMQDRNGVIPQWMHFIGQKNFTKPPLAPWSLIVVDNVWHIVTIWAVYQLWLLEIIK